MGRIVLEIATQYPLVKMAARARFTFKDKTEWDGGGGGGPMSKSS